MIRFACGTCKERLVVPDRHAGRKGKCPRCGTINRVPASSEFDEPEVPGIPGTPETPVVTATTPLPSRRPPQTATPSIVPPAPRPAFDRAAATDLHQPGPPPKANAEAKPTAPAAPAPVAAPATFTPPAQPGTPPAPRPGPRLFDRLSKRFGPKAKARADRADALDFHPDLQDAGGIPPAFKLLFVLGVLVLIPLLIGAAFVIMILLRVKLGS